MSEHILGESHFRKMLTLMGERGVPPNVNGPGEWWQEYKCHEKSNYQGSLYFNHITGDIWDGDLKSRQDMALAAEDERIRKLRESFDKADREKLLEKKRSLK